MAGARFYLFTVVETSKKARPNLKLSYKYTLKTPAVFRPMAFWVLSLDRFLLHTLLALRIFLSVESRLLFQSPKSRHGRYNVF